MKLFNIPWERAKQIIISNYPLVVIEGVLGFYLAYAYDLFSPRILSYVLLVILVANLLVHLVIISTKKQLYIDLSFLLLAIATCGSLAIAIFHQPAFLSATILVFIPTIVFTASLSLMFGVAGLILVILSIAGLITAITYLAPTDSYLNGPLLFAYVLLVILGILINYFMEVLRQKTNQLKKLAQENKELYQRTKTTADKIIESIRDGLIVLNDQYQIIRYNPILEKIIGQKDLTGKKIDQIGLSYSKTLVNYLNRLKNEEIREVNFKTKDKEKNIYQIKISQVGLDQNKDGFIVLINKQPLPWGKIYDSTTKKPVDLAIVRLFNAETNRVVSTEISGKGGQFGFIAPPGRYYLTVQRNSYLFPSRKEKEQYRGEEFEIKSPEDSFVKIKVPLDPTNEQADIEDNKAKKVKPKKINKEKK